MKNLAVIPARSGSKGLKDKNIKLLDGKPLLAHSINAAIDAGIYDKIHVSTDSDKYAEIARGCGGDVPFLRSKETSSDIASSWEAVKEVLQEYEKVGERFDTITLLQPTTPLRSSQDIINVYQLLLEKKANAVVSVCEVDHSPLWCNTLPEDKSLGSFIKKDISILPRQELEQYYRINGAVYMVRTKYFEECNSIYDSLCFAYVMDKRHSVDIDDEFDFKIAEAIIDMKV